MSSEETNEDDLSAQIRELTETLDRARELEEEVLRDIGQVEDIDQLDTQLGRVGEGGVDEPIEPRWSCIIISCNGSSELQEAAGIR